MDISPLFIVNNMLTFRQNKIFESIVNEHIKTAKPVSSAILFKKYNLGVSAATLRNDFQELDKAGLLYQPHTSSGRLITDQGWRYYVSSGKSLQNKEPKNINRSLAKIKPDQKIKEVTKILPAFTHSVVICGDLQNLEFYKFGISELFNQPEIQENSHQTNIAKLIEYFEDRFMKELENIEKLEIFIGQENFVSEAQDLSLLVEPYFRNEEKRGILAILGPKRMDYFKNISLLNQVVNWLEQE